MTEINYDKLTALSRELLVALGQDPEAEGLRDTPRRYANWWKEFLEYDPGKLGTTFTKMSSDQMIVVKDIKTWSLCEHHLLPFSSTIHIGYIAKNKILGLSKFARIAQLHAHQLQVQERMVDQIASTIQELTETENVAVYAEGVHLCMVMRGVRESSASMVTSCMRGVFLTKPEAREEFFRIINN